MLSHLTVKNIALIDHVELELAPGLTVLTGETGAGKSILVEALLLLLGARASADVIRQGEAEGVVEAIWHLDGDAAREVGTILDDAGLPPLEDGMLVLRRVVSREGRHKQQVNGALSTVAQLKAVAEPLVDFTGQHAHQALLRKEAALPLLDGFAGLDVDVDVMGQAWSRAHTLAAELSSLREKDAEKERRLDVIGFYLDEIQALSPEAGEDDSLEAERRKLMNAGRLRDAVAEARTLITDGDDDALTKSQQALVALRRAARDDASLEHVVDALESATAMLDDVARTLQGIGDIDDDPERLSFVDDRLDALRKVMKKHGGDLAGVLAAQAALSEEFATLTSATERIVALEGEVQAAVTDAAIVAARLTKARTDKSGTLAKAIEAELPALGMPNARVDVVVAPIVSASDTSLRSVDGAVLSRSGADLVELRFSANAGEAPAPLGKVASGGELSRVLLAVKRVLLDKDPVPVSVFDEVDAGVGGAVGEAIGEKLLAIAGSLDTTPGSRQRQVLCITHLPQIACRGDTHLVVKKGIADGRTVSQVTVVADDDRPEELARMLGGRDITETTRSHARELLSMARGPARAAVPMATETAAAQTHSDALRPKVTANVLPSTPPTAKKSPKRKTSQPAVH